MVFCTALRHLSGDKQLAQDVAQMVFVRLAQKAQSLSGQRTLVRWLFMDAFFTASKLVRSERRGIEREKQATSAIPISGATQIQTDELQKVEEIISQLRPKDGDALVLRFFEGLDFRAGDVQEEAQGGRYFAAETWADLGFGDPQSAAVTFFWALRNGDQAAYSGVGESHAGSCRGLGRRIQVG